MTKHNESCARVVVTRLLRSHGSRVIRSIAITRVFSQQQRWMFFQSKISIRGLAKSIRHSRRRSSVFRNSVCSVFLRVVCLASFSLEFFMHSSSLSSSSLHHFPGGDDFWWLPDQVVGRTDSFSRVLGSTERPR